MALYIVTSDFRGKLYLSFLITDITLLTFIITLFHCNYNMWLEIKVFIK